MRYTLKIEFESRGDCIACGHRISLHGDTMFCDGGSLYVSTLDPGQFIKAFYEEGFTEDITICAAS